MIIDVHTRVWSNPDQLGEEVSNAIRTSRSPGAAQVDASPAAHDRAMTCVDGSLIFAFRSIRLGINIPNELVAGFVSKDPQRRVGICGVDPLADDAMDRIDTGIGLGLAGVVISPACQGFHPTHSSAMRVYERCAEASLPVFVTMPDPLTNHAVLEFGRAIHLEEVAQTFPKLKIVIGQMGFPWIDETLVLLGTHPNLFADIAGVVARPWQLYNALLTATSLGVMEKLLFGSGFPFESPARAIETLYSVNSYSHGTHLPTIPRPLIRGIVERDCLESLGIDAEITARQTQVQSEEFPVSQIEVTRTRPTMLRSRHIP